MMGRPITHIIDPDGEVMIILRNANAPFAELYDDQDAISEMLAQEAPVEEDDHVQSQVETADDAAEHDWEGFSTSFSVKQPKRIRNKKKAKKTSRSFSAVETAVRPADEPEPAPEPQDELESKPEPEPEQPRNHEFWTGWENWTPKERIRKRKEAKLRGIPALQEDWLPALDSAAEPEPEPEHEPEHEPVDEFTQEHQSVHDVCIQVSAKHLISVSPVFKSMLTGFWKESVTFSNLQKGYIEITADSWDVDAFLILLKIVHCQLNHVPRKLDLEMLAKVTVIADYYKVEVVRFFSDIWIKALDRAYPEEYSRDLILRLWIAWFFRLSPQFRSATSIAMSHSSGFISNLGLPIPDRVIDKMNLRRQEAIESIICQLYEKQEAFLNDTRGCDFECSSIMYGALSKHMQSTGLLSPKPMAPFLRMSYNQIVQKVLSFKSPRWYRSSYTDHSCKDGNFRYLFPGLNENFDGFDLLELID